MNNQHLAVIGGSQFADQSLTKTSNVDQWAKDADLEWNIKSSPLMFDAGLVDLDGKPLYQEDKTKQVLYRSDNLGRLGIVGKDFKVVQPSQVLGFYGKISERLNVNLEAAGWVKNGSLIWGLADIGKSIRIKGQDEIMNYLMFSTANDGSRATCINFVSRRIICNNMLNYAFSQETSSPFSVRIPHMTEITPEKEHELIEEIVANSGTHWKNFETSANNMAETGMTLEQSISFFTQVLSVQGRDGVERLPEGKESTLLKMIDVFQSGVGQNTVSAKNTLWGAVNAVTRYTDHEVNYRSSQSAIATSQFGTGNTLKNRAFKVANQILKAA
jgi:phage/plasmid-like protein (TIGR03299 family)